MVKTIDELIADALSVQNASNLSGVARSFAQVTRELMDLRRSTKAVNEDLIVTLWLDKMLSLNNFSEEKANRAMMLALAHKRAHERLKQERQIQ